MDDSFDPTQYGAVAVEQPPFDPTQHGAIPVQQSEEPSILQKTGRAVVDTLKGFLPQSVSDVALAPINMIPGFGQAVKPLENIAFGRPISEGVSPLQGIPVVQRIPQIIQAEKTPAGSQERFTTGAGVVADLAMLSGFKSALHPELAEVAGIPKPPSATEVPLAQEAGIAKPDIAQPETPVATDSVTQATVQPPEPVSGKVEPVAPNLPTGTGGDMTVFRGESKGPSPAGEAHGIGTYYGLTPEDAQRFSQQGTVQPHNVTLENPAVVNSDAELRAIRTDAGVNPDPRMLLSGNEAARFTQYLQGAGHDSFVTNYGDAPGGKQVVVFPKTEPVSEAPVSTTAPLSTQTEGVTGDSGSTQPATQEQVARPEPQVPQTFSVQMPTDAFGTEQTPVASALQEMGGVLSKSGAKKAGKLEGNSALWDDVQPLSHPTHNKIYSLTGEKPDVAAQTLHDAGLISDPSPTTMWKAVADESKSSRNILKSQKSEIETQKFKLQETSKQAQDFGKAQKEGWKGGEPVVPVKDLQVGDHVEVKGEKLKVVDIDPDSFDVTLEDGKKYGVQTVKDGTVIYGEHESTLPKPKLLAGENQGDLISSTQKEPFSLVGEKGTDFGAQQAAAEKATAERAQSEKGQMELGQEPTPATVPTETGETPVVSDDQHVSTIANRFTEERTASGELGEIAPGQGYSTKEMAAQGLKMSPEEINQHVSDLMHGTGDPIEQGKAVRAEEARLSQRSNDLSRAAAADPTNVEAKLAADNAFNDVTDFHNGPVAKLKSIFHATGVGLQGELPVDLSTFNGLREAFLKDTGKVPTPEQEPQLQAMAEKVTKSVAEDNGAKQSLGQAIEKATARRKLPSYDEVRQNIADRMKIEPCRT